MLANAKKSTQQTKNKTSKQKLQEPKLKTNSTAFSYCFLDKNKMVVQFLVQISSNDRQGK